MFFSCCTPVPTYKFNTIESLISHHVDVENDTHAHTLQDKKQVQTFSQNGHTPDSYEVGIQAITVLILKLRHCASI